MGLISEFKTFIVKGNAIDLAVGIVIGAAFGAIVKSLVDDLMMPPIGALLAGVDFSSLSIKLKDAVPPGGTLLNGLTNNSTKEVPAVVIAYGKFINALIALLIQGIAVFLVVKGINRLKRKEVVAPSSPPVPTKEEILLTDIRDILARK